MGGPPQPLGDPSRLPNPEAGWEPPAPGAWEDEVRRRLGPDAGPLRLLGGGLANLTVQVGADRVARLYRRDPGALGKEVALLRLGARSFRVPAVLERGADHLVLERVEHRPLGGERADGEDAGQALAELHARTYPRAGLLGDDLTVTEPFDDVVGALLAHVEERLAGPTALPRALGARLLATLRAHAPELRRRASPAVLLHGDFKASNLHRADDGRLLVLDWEFAWAGPAWMDVGQLLRWGAGPGFTAGFAEAYRAGGGVLPDDWETWAERFDLVNLVGLTAGVAPSSRRAHDVAGRIEATVVRAGR